MNNRLTNAHIHIFVSECAPPGFLKVKPFKALKFFAKPIKWLIEGQSARERIWKLNKWVPFLSHIRKVRLDRVISFLNVGAQLSQEDVFEISLKAAKSYGTNPRLVAHTLDMDFMDTNSIPLIPYATQLYEVIKLKRDYPDNIFPFVSADPRSKSGLLLVNWIKYYFTHGVKSNIDDKILPYCSGIKLYPAHGFFPFDPRLDDLYKFAEENNIPLMFHCTREGSQYIGSEIESLIPNKPKMIMPKKTSPAYNNAQTAQQDIYTRISKYYGKDDWIKNSKIGINDYSCDLFSHPQNYIPIMCKYPKLKICLAHMGGATEVEHMYAIDLQSVKAKKKLKEIWATDGHNWALLIKEMMKKYHCFYTDISSTITHLDDDPVLQNIRQWLNETDNADKQLGNRILFGTDFFLTEMSHSEVELYGFMQNKLGGWFEKMAGVNTNNYLNQKCKTYEIH